MEALKPTQEQPNGTYFDSQKAYQPQEKSGHFDDGREIQLLHFIYSLSNIAELHGNPEKVLAAIDLYGRTKKFLMNVGVDKGKIVTDLIAEVKPHTMVELGGYCGYSAILFGDALRKAGGKRYLSLERSPEFAAVILTLVDLAGLSDIVKVIVGPSAHSLKQLHDSGTVKQIDLLFIDHHKPAYTVDLKLCEHLKLVAPGSVVAADNVIKPGNPAYLAYIRSSVEEKRKVFNSDRENKDDALGFTDRYNLQYGKDGIDALTSDIKGNPNLVYDTKIVHSFEPTGVPDGVEISRCIEEASQ